MQGWTALHVAGSEGFEDLVDLLLRQGANVDALTAQVWTRALLLSSCSQGLSLRGEPLLESHCIRHILSCFGVNLFCNLL